MSRLALISLPNSCHFYTLKAWSWQCWANLRWGMVMLDSPVKSVSALRNVSVLREGRAQSPIRTDVWAWSGWNDVKGCNIVPPPGAGRARPGAVLLQQLQLRLKPRGCCCWFDPCSSINRLPNGSTGSPCCFAQWRSAYMLNSSLQTPSAPETSDWKRMEVTFKRSILRCWPVSRPNTSKLSAVPVLGAQAGTTNAIYHGAAAGSTTEGASKALAVVWHPSPWHWLSK